MEHDVTPFWADIKKYEEALVNDPASYCFVTLADLYRRIGLLDDAIHVAKKGCDIHPDYVGGYMALGRAYFEKGMKPESKAALEKVIASTPDNLLARRLLSQIYVEFGEIAAAAETLRFILSYNPADHESQVLLNSLRTSSTPDHHQESLPTAGTAGREYQAFDSRQFEFFPEDDEVIEDAELLEEVADQVTPEEEEFIFTPPDEAFAETGNTIFIEEHDPLRTATMAELYVSQGFLKRALTIYRELLETEPNNAEWKNRLYELKMAIDEDTAKARQVVTTESAAETGISQVSEQPDSGLPNDETSSPANANDRALMTLEKWLETIRRGR
jgi:tetratricopeptide (TPR) repeat protein